MRDAHAGARIFEGGLEGTGRERVCGPDNFYLGSIPWENKTIVR